MREKILLINERLAIGWVGSPFKAASVVKALRERWPVSAPNSVDLERFLEAEVETVGLSCEFTGWLRENEVWFGFRWNSASFGTFERVDECILGTGQEALTALLRNPQFTHQSGPAVHRAALLAGLLALEESVTGETLQMRFGGGIQVIYGELDNLRKLESLLIGLAVVMPDGGVRLAKRLVKYGTSGGAFFIAAMDCAQVNGAKPEAFVLPVEPLVADGRPSRIGADVLSLRSELIALAVRFFLPEGCTDTGIVVSGQSSRDLHVAIDSAGRQQLVVEKRIFEILASKARRLARAKVEQRDLVNFAGGITIWSIVTPRSATGRQVICETGNVGAGPCIRLEISPESRLQLTVIDRANVAASAGVPAEPFLDSPIRVIGELHPLGGKDYELRLAVDGAVVASARASLLLDVELLPATTIGAGRRIPTVGN